MVLGTDNIYKTPRYTACFRQFGAEGTHCRFTHAYKIWFKVTFTEDILFITTEYPEFEQYLNEWFEKTFNYKTFVAKDDPKLEMFEYLNNEGVIDLVKLPNVGCERFSEFVMDEVNKIIDKFGLDMKCTQVETWEHEKNSGVAYN